MAATDYGIPQIRKRLFVIASKEALTKPFPEKTYSIQKNDLYSHQLKDCPTLWDAISDLPQIQAREGAEEINYDKDAGYAFGFTPITSSRNLPLATTHIPGTL